MNPTPVPAAVTLPVKVRPPVMLAPPVVTVKGLSYTLTGPEQGTCRMSVAPRCRSMRLHNVLATVPLNRLPVNPVAVVVARSAESMLPVAVDVISTEPEVPETVVTPDTEAEVPVTATAAVAVNPADAVTLPFAST